MQQIIFAYKANSSRSTINIFNNIARYCWLVLTVFQCLEILEVPCARIRFWSIHYFENFPFLNTNQIHNSNYFPEWRSLPWCAHSKCETINELAIKNIIFSEYDIYWQISIKYNILEVPNQNHSNVIVQLFNFRSYFDTMKISFSSLIAQAIKDQFS